MTAPIPTEGGPYRAEFGAVVHDDFGGALFTVSPPHLADLVADALNANARTLPALLEALTKVSMSAVIIPGMPSEAALSVEVLKEVAAALAQATGGEDVRR